MGGWGPTGLPLPPIPEARSNKAGKRLGRGRSERHALRLGLGLGSGPGGAGATGS
jgi:hypothetical protein